jgi:hypothetical protein
MVAEHDYSHPCLAVLSEAYSQRRRDRPGPCRARGRKGRGVTIGAAEDAAVTAIDIALEPDDTMVHHAQAANAVLLKDFPQGFSLDATHQPHVSMFAGFVPTDDLHLWIRCAWSAR